MLISFKKHEAGKAFCPRRAMQRKTVNGLVRKNEHRRTGEIIAATRRICIDIIFHL
jgi:hypothetical protein